MLLSSPSSPSLYPIINTDKPSLLHAIYAAHGSDRNTIRHNYFLRNDGDPIRIRDFSNGNIITNNEFSKTGIDAAFTERYCDHDTRTDCTKPTPECPSWNNQFRDNELNGDADCKQLRSFKYIEHEDVSGCTKPAGAKRLSTNNNVQNTAACGK